MDGTSCTNATFAERVRHALEVREMSQADLARLTGMSQAVISQIVNGKTKDPHFSRVVAIAKALDVSLNYLAGYK